MTPDSQIWIELRDTQIKLNAVIRELRVIRAELEALKPKQAALLQPMKGTGLSE